MNDNQLDDLKQFIITTVSQSEQRIKDELRQEIQEGNEGLRQEMREGFAGIS